MRSKTRFSLSFSSLLLITPLLALLLAGCDPTEQAPGKPTPRLVRTQTITLQPREGWREFPGVVEAAQTADLGFRVSGKLSQLLVEEGDTVKAGQVLARLDDTDYKIQLNSRRAEFEQAEADYERAKRLLGQKLIAQADVDKLKAQFTATGAALEAAQQNVDYTTIKAPFTGLIARRYVDNFEDIAASQAIYTLQDLSSLHIKVDVPETVMIHLKNRPSYNIYAIFDALKDQKFPLEMLAVATAADPGSRTFSVTFTMAPVAEMNVLPGMSVTVRGGESSSMAIVVPPEAILDDGEGQIAFVVEEINGNQGVVHERPVTIEGVSEQGIVVLTGLAPGDRLVIAGMSKMYEGLTVRLNEEWSK
ncbi:efflux RND transporter periplasmic adaptor subunit [Halioxenophilus sp. WMMB6]|uniref:efflux RND transporter periplasmic adaptor subunit n=1 Tax=Halioxenophilus sp. WMMB6 TaxID=3073815 RepID=UPI00295E826A|nr:efflux RND transporter periplasmic adaptor subunit [Halioxenophilus sp. WMMB6]